MDSPLPSGVRPLASDSPRASSNPRPQRAPRRGKARRQWRVTSADTSYAREMLTPIVLGVLVIVMVLSANFVYWGINSVVNQGLGLAPLLRLFLLAIPGFSIQGVAVGVILGVCLVLSRAVRDNEVMALRSAGASVVRILTPFWLVAALASGFVWVLLEHIAPRTNDMAEKTMQKLMHTSAAKLIEGDKYFRVGEYYFYVQDVRDKVLHNVMIYERNSGAFASVSPATFPTVIIAKEAQENPVKPNSWILKDVVTHLYHENGTFSKQIVNSTYEINVGQELSSYWADQKNPFSMTGSELNKRIKALETAAFDPRDVRKMRVTYYRRFSMPAACFVMALLAAPLSLRFARHGSFAGLVCAFGLAFVYQAMDSFFNALGIAGRVEPVVSAWATNGILSLLGLVLIWRER